jgi:hypothetical protein
MKEKREKAIKKDLSTLATFFQIYCSGVHSSREKDELKRRGILKRYFIKELSLCAECQRHFYYAAVKRILCPYFPKPACKKCPTICYTDGHRQFMREMMRFSGKYLMSRGRIDLIFKYFF